MRVVWPAHLTVLDIIALLLFIKINKSEPYLPEFFQLPVTSSLSSKYQSDNISVYFPLGQDKGQYCKAMQVRCEIIFQ
jgi:hypothetical protein